MRNIGSSKANGSSVVWIKLGEKAYYYFLLTPYSLHHHHMKTIIKTKF